MFDEVESLKSLVRELTELLPGTYGEAVQSGIIEHGECENHEWDNRTYAENAAWLIRRRTAQRNEARAELAKYKEAIVAQLQYDMKSVISDTPERRALLEKHALEQSLRDAEDRLEMVVRADFCFGHKNEVALAYLDKAIEGWKRKTDRGE